jgi:hypothetical protein
MMGISFEQFEILIRQLTNPIRKHLVVSPETR